MCLILGWWESECSPALQRRIAAVGPTNICLFSFCPNLPTRRRSCLSLSDTSPWFVHPFLFLPISNPFIIFLFISSSCPSFTIYFSFFIPTTTLPFKLNTLILINNFFLLKINNFYFLFILIVIMIVKIQSYLPPLVDAWS